MSTVVDVGDATEYAYISTPGADVQLLWLDPDLATVDDVDLTENPAGSGRYPYTFLPTRAGMWTARFIASGAATAVDDLYIRALAVTGLPPLAALGDVTNQMSLTTAQEGLARWLIRQASALVRNQYRRIDAQIADGRLDPDVAALAVANMVLRVLRNPAGLRGETVGPFSRTYDTTAAAGLLVVSGSETSMLQPTGPAAGRGPIGTVRVTPGLIPQRSTGCGVYWQH